MNENRYQQQQQRNVLCHAHLEICVKETKRKIELNSNCCFSLAVVHQLKTIDDARRKEDNAHAMISELEDDFAMAIQDKMVVLKIFDEFLIHFVEINTKLIRERNLLRKCPRANYRR